MANKKEEIRKETIALYKSEKRLKEFFTQVFWRNARIEGLEGEESETGLSKLECDAIQTGIDSIVFHVHQDLLAFLPPLKGRVSSEVT